ncbi:SDR family NAD(P)-dependent oxidoreductase [Streptomyces sp. NPDC048281]|uniref:SDR family NAD(P)-dependent oxidoreductase n=1 Tax=Streptomyces sp. NPDC048281 TaxID=3154715 RepID=UPI00343FCEDB
MTDKYGPWGIVAGGSDGVGAAFAEAMAARGINLVLVARRVPLLESAADVIRRRYGVQVRTVPLDLATDDAPVELADATADLEIGLLVYNAGSDDSTADFLDREPADHLRLVRRNCVSALETVHHFGAPMALRGRGGVILVTSGAAWAGGATRATYGATKAFGLVLAESLWAEWRAHGVDVLALVLGRTDTPSLHRLLGDEDQPLGGLADPVEAAEEALTHLGDGPTWISGSADPAGASPVGALSRRDAVLAMNPR